MLPHSRLAASALIYISVTTCCSALAFNQQGRRLFSPKPIKNKLLLTKTTSMAAKMELDGPLSYRDMQKICKERGIAANGTTDAMRTRLFDDLGISATKADEIDSMSAKGVDFSAFAHDPKEFESSSPAKRTRPSPRKIQAAPSTPMAMKITPSPKEKVISEGDEVHVVSTPKRKKSPKAVRVTSSSRKRQRIEPGSLTPPKNWETLYSLVEELRADRTAPLDTDGGEALPERHLGEKAYRFQVLVALMLSSQTKDAVVGDTMRALQQHGLTVENIHATEPTVLNGLINKVGFHNNKTKYLKLAAEMLINDYDGDIPPTADEMMKLAGVGPKMVCVRVCEMMSLFAFHYFHMNLLLTRTHLCNLSYRYVYV